MNRLQLLYRLHRAIFDIKEALESDEISSVVLSLIEDLEHICCDGECNHDDCCGKVEANCPLISKEK